MLNHLSLRTNLIAVFLILGILPLTVVAKLVGNFYADSMREQSLRQLISTRDVKEEKLSFYFKQLEDQTLHFVGDVKKKDMSHFNTPVLRALNDFKFSVASLDKENQNNLNILKTLFIEGSGDKANNTKVPRSLYDNLHEDLHPIFTPFIERFNYMDILLLDKEGNVLYTVTKNAHIGENVLQGSLASSGLNKAFISAREQGNALGLDASTQTYFTDFSVDPVTKVNTAYLANPLFDFGIFTGMIIYQISDKNINQIMLSESSFGRHGESYLVGTDFKLRASTYNLTAAPSHESKPGQVSEPSQENKDTRKNSSSIVNQTVNLEPVQLALNGKSFEGNAQSYLNEEALNASKPISVFGNPWAVVAEITTQEAYSDINKLNQIVLSIGIVSAIIIAGIALFLSNAISRPLVNLSQVAEEMASGDLEKEIQIKGSNELGRLSQSFSRMRDAIRHKITEIEKQNQELLHLDQMKDDLLANTSHELRTPLNGIIGLSESLLSHVPKAQLRTLHHVISNGRRLASLVNDILDAASLRNKSVKVEKSALNLRRIVDLDFSVSAYMLEGKNITLSNKVDPDIFVSADQNRLQQIFQNLIGNAIKFTQQGEIEVLAKQNDDLIEIHVKDSGEGISETDQERIFIAFEQADGSSTRKAGGTGLGLAITKNLIELHGGTLRVESKKGQGSNFIFTLPKSLEKDTDSDKTEFLPKTLPKPLLLSPASDKNNELGDTSLTHLSQTTQNSHNKEFVILVVDDEPVNLEIVVNHLAQSFCTVITSTSGMDALEKVKIRKPDLILLDVMMPELNGYDTCKQLRQDYSAYELPIIFLTARNQLKDLIEAFNSGGNDYLSKPFFKEELLSRVQIQIELSIQKQRMSKLRQFANNISEYKSQEDMATATYDLVLPDPIVEQAALYFDGQMTQSSTESFAPDFGSIAESEQAEYLEDETGTTTMFARLSDYYMLATQFPRSSSEEWIRNLVGQVEKSMEQIRRISSDPKVTLVQSEIKQRLDNIYYVKVEDNYCLIFVEQEGKIKEEVHRIQLKQVLMYLNKDELYQINRGIAVNPDKIISFNKSSQEIKLEGDIKLPVSKRFVKELRKDKAQLF